MEKLKRCPFCGKDVAVVSNLQDCEICANFEDENCPNYETEGSDGCPHFIICDHSKGGCGAATGWYLTLDEAAEAWNRRDENG